MSVIRYKYELKQPLRNGMKEVKFSTMIQTCRRMNENRETKRIYKSKDMKVWKLVHAGGMNLIYVYRIQVLNSL